MNQKSMLQIIDFSAAKEKRKYTLKYSARDLNNLSRELNITDPLVLTHIYMQVDYMGEKKRAKDLNRLAPQIKALLTGRKQICDFNEHDAVVIGRTFADFSSALGIMMAFRVIIRSCV